MRRDRRRLARRRGEPEIDFQQVSELLPIQGIDNVGPLPAEVQKVTLFSADIAAHVGTPGMLKWTGGNGKTALRRSFRPKRGQPNDDARGELWVEFSRLGG